MWGELLQGAGTGRRPGGAATAANAVRGNRPADGLACGLNAAPAETGKEALSLSGPLHFSQIVQESVK